MKLSIEEKLLAKRIINSETNCWELTLKPITNGYVQMHTGPGNHKELVHRLAYSIWKDKTLSELKQLKSDGIEIMHSCDNRICFNPDHLSLGTRKENIDDMYSKGRLKAKNGNVDKTECIRGHSLLAKENVYLYKRAMPNGEFRYERKCKACQRNRASLVKR